jgi:hypothetical protein
MEKDPTELDELLLSDDIENAAELLYEYQFFHRARNRPELKKSADDGWDELWILLNILHDAIEKVYLEDMKKIGSVQRKQDLHKEVDMLLFEWDDVSVHNGDHYIKKLRYATEVSVLIDIRQENVLD